MKKINFLVIGTIILSMTFLTTLIGQTCNTTPQPGQTVGKCISGSSEEGQYAACGIYFEGPICFFGEPVIRD